MLHRRQFHQFLLAGAAGTLAAPSRADSYPARLITLVVAYAAGGSTDQRARQFARSMADTLGQKLIVDNRPGAAGNIGTDQVARARPDGYTLGMGNFGPLAVNPWLFRKLPFDPLADLTMIALIERGPLMLVVHPGSTVRSVPELVATSQARPGGLSYGSSGAGSAHHLCGEMLKAATQGRFTHIPYRSGAAAMSDLYGGHLDFMFEPMYSALPSARAGRVRPLAITSRARSPLMPELPTVAETGLAGFHMENWQGLVGPAGLPRPIVERLNGAVNRALGDPEIKAQMLAQGNELGGGTPEEFRELVRSEAERWGAVVRANGIVPE